MTSSVALLVPAPTTPRRAAARRSAPAPPHARAAAASRTISKRVADLFLQRFRASRRSPRGARGGRGAHEGALSRPSPRARAKPTRWWRSTPPARVAAFCGGMRARFRFDGRPVSACVTGTLMASDGARPCALGGAYPAREPQARLRPRHHRQRQPRLARDVPGGRLFRRLARQPGMGGRCSIPPASRCTSCGSASTSARSPR